MNTSSQCISFSVFSSLYDFTTSYLNSEFLKDRLTADAFLVGVNLITVISTKLAAAGVYNKVTLTKKEFDFLKDLFIMMKSDCKQPVTRIIHKENASEYYDLFFKDLEKNINIH